MKLAGFGSRNQASRTPPLCVSNKHLNHKVAVLMAGPIRYAPLVLERLVSVLDGLEFEVFALIWKKDLGNKRRDRDILADTDRLIAHPKVSACIVAAPFHEEFYRSTIGIQTGSNSTINATMGMFYSMSALYGYVEQLPNRKSFTHALRIRTDCLIVASSLIPKLDFRSGTLTVSQNPFIPSTWLSDHLTFGTWSDFGKLWAFDKIEDIYNLYNRGRRNPERTLAVIARRRAKNIRIVPNLMRYIDYHIVYCPAREHEPAWVKDALEGSDVDALFMDPSVFIDKKETESLRVQLTESQRKLDQNIRMSHRIMASLRQRLAGLLQVFYRE